MVLMGHSTGEEAAPASLHDRMSSDSVKSSPPAGCQDIVYFLRHGQRASAVSGAILQAPVSDREYYRTLDDTADRLERAKSLVVRSARRRMPLCCLARHRHSGLWSVTMTPYMYLRRLQGRATHSCRITGGAWHGRRGARDDSTTLVVYSRWTLPFSGRRRSTDPTASAAAATRPRPRTATTRSRREWATMISSHPTSL